MACCVPATNVIQLAHMKTLVLRIPDSLAHELAAEAKQLKTTRSAVARQRLTSASSPNAEGLRGFSLIADLVGCVKGRPAT